MRCELHHTEANAICPYCGRAMCATCTPVQKEGRRACSEECVSRLVAADKMLLEHATKGKRTMKANVAFCLMLGGLFVLLGVAPIVMKDPPWILMIMLVLMGGGMIVGGLIYAFAARAVKNPA